MNTPHLQIESAAAEARVRILADEDIADVSPRPRDGKRYEAVQNEYRDLVARLRLTRPKHASDPWCVAVTSATGQTGVSTVSTHIAMALAESHTGRTLLVDANADRPALQRVFQIPGDAAGLSNVTDAQELTPNSVFRVPAIPGLYVMPAGDQDRKNALRDPVLLEGALTALKCDFDFIVLDLAPCYQPSNGLTFAALADVSLLVIQSESSKRSDVQRTQQWMHDAGVNLVGTVLNQFRDPMPRILKPFFG